VIALTGAAHRVVTIADFGAAALGVRLSMGSLAGEPGGEHGLRAAAVLADEGRFRVPVQHVLPASDAAGAHRALETGPRLGKVAITADW